MLDVNASGNVPTTFTRLLGQEKLDIGSSAQVKWGVKKLELALVLDNTGSMASSGKLTQLKLASHNLLTTLQTAAKQPGDVKVAIIPFDTKVNIGTGYAGQSWMDYSVNNIQQNQWQGCVHGSRPAERHDRYDADLRHPHQVSGRAVLRPDLDDDADRHPRHDRLHQSQFEDRRHAGGRATPT